MAKLHKAEVKSPEDIRNWIRIELHERYEKGWQAGYKEAFRDLRLKTQEAYEDGYQRGQERTYERAATDALSAVLSRLGDGRPIDATLILRDLLKTEGLFNG